MRNARDLPLRSTKTTTGVLPTAPRLPCPLAAMLVRLFASDVRLIGLDDFSRAAERVIAAKRFRSFAKAMKQKPRGFVIRANHALQLQGAETLL